MTQRLWRRPSLRSGLALLVILGSALPADCLCSLLPHSHGAVTAEQSPHRDHHAACHRRPVGGQTRAARARDGLAVSQPGSLSRRLAVRPAPAVARVRCRLARPAAVRRAVRYASLRAPPRQ